MRRPALLAALAALTPAVASAKPPQEPPPEPWPTVDVEAHAEVVVVPPVADDVDPEVPAMAEPPEEEPEVAVCGLRGLPPKKIRAWHGGFAFGGGEIGHAQSLFSFGVEAGYRFGSLMLRTDYTFGVVSTEPGDLRREGAFHRAGAGLRWIFAEPDRVPINVFGDAGLGRRWLDPRRGKVRTSSDLELALGLGIGGSSIDPSGFGSAIRVAVQVTRADDPSAVPKAACAGSTGCGPSDDRYGVSIIGTWNVYFAR